MFIALEADIPALVKNIASNRNEKFNNLLLEVTNDFKSDKKWQNYLDWCDRYFWAVDAKFPINILPSDTGLIIADAYDASIFREAPLNKLSAARRKKITKSIARSACNRLLTHTDPKI